VMLYTGWEQLLRRYLGGFGMGGWLSYGPPPEHQWVEMADNREEYDSWDYFPLWDGHVDEDGTNAWHLVDPLRSFVPLSRGGSGRCGERRERNESVECVEIAT
jgi:hypothetical protein